MKKRKARKPTRCQEQMVAMFKAGATILDVALELTEWPLNKESCEERVENALRVTLAWQKRGDDEP